MSEGTSHLNGITEDPLDVAGHLAAVEGSRFGAIATFIGRVRDHDPDVSGEVVSLDYTAHPDAERILAQIIEDCRSRARENGDEVAIAASHRIGHLVVGDVAIVACVASAHRAAAFEVCRDLVETIKADLPIWKRQWRSDGSHNWVGIGD